MWLVMPTCPHIFRAAATRGGDPRSPSLPGCRSCLEQLKADDEDMFANGTSGQVASLPVATSRSRSLRSWNTLPPARHVLVIGAIGDREDATAVAGDAQAGLRCPGIPAGNPFGRDSRFGANWAMLRQWRCFWKRSDRATQRWCRPHRPSLMKLRGVAVDEAIVAKIDRVAPGARVILLDLVGQMAIPSAIPAVLRAADDSDEQVRLAAIKTLGRIAGLKEFAFLTRSAVGDSIFAGKGGGARGSESCVSEECLMRMRASG